MDFMTITGQMLSLFFIMVVGYVIYKLKVIDDEATVRFTRLVLNVSVPALIITSFLNNQGVVSNLEVLEVLGISLFCHVIFGLLGFAFTTLFCVPEKERGMYLFMSLFGNVGFMGFPVITAVFGDAMMIYAVIFNVVFNILVYSAGILLIGNGGEKARFNPRLLLNMPLMSAVVSVLLFVLKIPLPSVINTSLDYLGELTTPMAMVILGATIASMPVRELFDGWKIYVFTALRLLVIPAAVLVVLRALHITSPEITGVMAVLAGTPVATNATMLAIQYGGNRQLASKGIFFTTILSIITIPLIALLC